LKYYYTEFAKPTLFFQMPPSWLLVGRSMVHVHDILFVSIQQSCNTRNHIHIVSIYVT
jgi:hypothetical protein